MRVDPAYELAKERSAAFGIDTDAAIKKALSLPISLHYWQGDDVVGFDTKPGGLAGGGTMATGNYPGRAPKGEAPCYRLVPRHPVAATNSQQFELLAD